jgi:hypothetical protein
MGVHSLRLDELPRRGTSTFNNTRRYTNIFTRMAKSPILRLQPLKHLPPISHTPSHVLDLLYPKPPPKAPTPELSALHVSRINTSSPRRSPNTMLRSTRRIQNIRNPSRSTTNIGQILRSAILNVAKIVSPWPSSL